MAKRIQRSTDSRRSPAVGIVAFALTAMSPIACRESQWDLAHGFWKRDRELAARVVGSKESFSDCLSNFFAAVPGTNDARNVLIDPVDRSRPTRHQHDHYWLAGFRQLLHQQALMAGQIQTKPRL